MSDDIDMRERPSDGGRPRAVLSPMDFDLLKEAVGEYIRNLPDDDTRSRQFTQLYHRLGRAG
ncbi:hypothetical protein [Sphingomonas sp.]|uniref:hypothetical protein n=1 Tax=Sphingomonas sp. TaxID=28214 RepID=UPI002D7F0E43|nr:hypothetical protein [Sphingomonas sp.]HEU0043876.1 hypothetical protein [Sphingomonas sp.]